MLYDTLFKNLNPSTIVLTVNQRLSSFLKNEYSLFQQKQGKQFWETPDILPLQTWLLRQWENIKIQNETLPTLLIPLQTHILWQEIVQNSSQKNNVLNLHQTAELAQGGWELCQNWQIDWQHEIFLDNEETKTWQQWAKTFSEALIKNYWLDATSLLSFFNTHIHLLKDTQKTLYLAGFDEIIPDQKIFFDQLKKIGFEIDEYKLTNLNQKINKIALVNSEDEIKTMARWANDQLSKNPDQRIACIIPNLDETREKVFNIFCEVIIPEKKWSTHNDLTLPFNLSAGEPLSSFPLIQTALLLLSLRERVSFDTISKLLRSPFLRRAETEYALRAKFEAALRQSKEPELLLENLIRESKRWGITLFTSPSHYSASDDAKKPIRYWSQHFKTILEQFGWPGERTLNSTEYQLTQRFIAALEEFISLDSLLGEISHKKAESIFSKLVHKIIFQPESKNASIQILGLLESTGLFFDQIWIMGLESNAWPTPAKKNPFLPHALQKKLQLPHSSNQREQLFCQKITERLFQAAPHIILSFPEQEQDKPLFESFFIRDIHKIELNDLSLSPFASLSEKILKTSLLEEFEDRKAPPWKNLEKIHGGSSLFKDQSACPFRAFANFRLHTKNLEIPVFGLSPQERGNLLHAALEVFWNSVQTQSALNDLDEETLSKTIDDSINTTLLHFIKKRPLTFKKVFTQIEKNRLFILLKTWINVEKKRPPFIVSETEKSFETSLAGIPLKLRLDRIDSTETRQKILIDYKTSETNLSDWFGDRPDQPQLPLYAILNPEPIQALLFAEVRAQAATYKGISHQETNIPGVALQETTWENHCIDWKKNLETLAEEFKQGDASVNPKYGEQTCQYCNLTALCRKHQV